MPSDAHKRAVGAVVGLLLWACAGELRAQEGGAEKGAERASGDRKGKPHKRDGKGKRGQILDPWTGQWVDGPELVTSNPVGVPAA